MSRSNPSDNLRNPAIRWHEWSGAKGIVRFYDKEQKKDIEVGSQFTFIILDELSVVKGWCDEFGAGITSNEVRDVGNDKMTVRVFKGPILGKGLYSEIKDQVKSAGGRFNCNCYIAFKDGENLKVGSLMLKGAALNAWVEFKKFIGEDLYKKAIKINGSKDGKKGTVSFKIPVFEISELSEMTNKEAVKLDEILQAYLKPYIEKNRSESRSSKQEHEEEDPVPAGSSKEDDDIF